MAVVAMSLKLRTLEGNNGTGLAKGEETLRFVDSDNTTGRYVIPLFRILQFNDSEVIMINTIEVVDIDLPIGV